MATAGRDVPGPAAGRLNPTWSPLVARQQGVNTPRVGVNIPSMPDLEGFRPGQDDRVAYRGGR